jgi:hypothetical protein
MCILLTVARQWLGKHIPAMIQTHTAIEDLLDALFSMWSMSYQRKAGNYFFPEFLVVILYYLAQ